MMNEEGDMENIQKGLEKSSFNTCLKTMERMIV